MKRLVALALALALGVFADAGVAQPAGDPGALPPGHPGVGAPDDDAADDALPPGHPHVEDPDDDPHAGDPHAQSPHAGGADDDGMQDLRNRIYRPPPDGAGDDAALPAGTIVAGVRDAQDKPLVGAKVGLSVLHSTVAKGESKESFAKETDANGEVRFDHLEAGSSTTYRVTTARAGGSYATQPFALNDRVGKRAVVHAFETSRDIEHMPVLTEVVTYLALREDAIVVEELVTVMNLGPTAWLADATFALPDGFKAFNKQDATSDARVDEVSGKGAALRGTFGPGSHELDFRYQIPLDETARQRLVVETPPHTWRSRVMAEAARSMGLEVKGFPPAERSQNREGKHILQTERTASREEGGQRQLDVTLTGLPTAGPGRWIAAAIAAIVVLYGLASVFSARRGLDPDAKKDLEDAREALLAEIVTLERLHKRGEVGPKTYARVRASLVAALGRVLEQLAAPQPEAPASSSAAPPGKSDGSANPRKRRRDRAAAGRAV